VDPDLKSGSAPFPAVGPDAGAGASGGGGPSGPHTRRGGAPEGGGCEHAPILVKPSQNIVGPIIGGSVIWALLGWRALLGYLGGVTYFHTQASGHLSAES